MSRPAVEAEQEVCSIAADWKQQSPDRVDDGREIAPESRLNSETPRGANKIDYCHRIIRNAEASLVEIASRDQHYKRTTFIALCTRPITKLISDLFLL